MTTISDERLAEMQLRVAKIVRRYADDVPPVKQFLHDGEDRLLVDYVSALRAQGGVRPLEWRFLKSEYPETYEATGILPGAYRVFIDEDSAAGAIFAEWALDPDHFGTSYAKSIGRFSDWEPAKAAAQADYERRIGSAREASPAPVSKEIDPRLYHLHVEALAEIKATVDGDSDQPVRDIIYGLLEEIAALPAKGGQ